ncbi:hypothetical protein P1X16_14845 [Hymenobacter sp. YC55]|nr:hypothetical protein [Hymenobacter sp. YC55]
MKIQKLAMSALLIGTTIGVAQAQTEAGKMLISATVNYSRSNNESNSTGSIDYPGYINATYRGYSFNFSPQAGLFVADNLALGFDFGVGTGNQKDKRTEYNSSSDTFLYYNSEATNKRINVGTFVRYYKMLGEKAGFYGQLSGGYQRQTGKQNFEYTGNTNRNDSYNTKTRGGYAMLMPGFVYFPSQKVWDRPRHGWLVLQ